MILDSKAGGFNKNMMGGGSIFKGIEQIKSYNQALGTSINKTQAYQKTLQNAEPWAKKLIIANKGNAVGFKDGAKNMALYSASLVGATIKTVALQAVSMTLNAALTWGLSIGIQALVTWVDNWIHADEKLRDSVEETTSAYREQMSTINSSRKTLSDMGEDFDELSKGVNANGENVSLTNVEYESYLNMANQIAEIAPALVKGYDEQGNAILKYGTTIQKVNDLLDEQIKKSEKALLAGEGNTSGYEGFTDALTDAQTTLTKLEEKYDGGLFDIFNRNWSSAFTKLYSDTLVGLASFGDRATEEFEKILDAANIDRSDVLYGYSDVDQGKHGVVLKPHFYYELTDEQVGKIKAYVQEQKEAYQQALEDAARDLIPYIEAYVHDIDAYSNLDGMKRTIVDNYIPQFDIIDDNGKIKSLDSIKAETEDFVNMVNNLSDEQVNYVIQMQSLLNSEEHDLGDLRDKWKQIEKAFGKDSNITKVISIMFNIDNTTFAHLDDLTKKFGKDSVDYFESLSPEQLEEVWSKSSLFDSLDDLKTYLEQIELQSDLTAKSFSDIYTDDVKDDIEAIIQAEEDMTDSNYLSLKSVKALQENGLDDYLISTENGWTLAKGALDNYIDGLSSNYTNAVNSAIEATKTLTGASEDEIEKRKGNIASLLEYVKGLKEEAIAVIANARTKAIADALSDESYLESVKSINNTKGLSQKEKTSRIGILQSTTIAKVSSGFSFDKVDAEFDPVISNLQAIVDNGGKVEDLYEQIKESAKRDSEDDSSSDKKTIKKAEDRIAYYKHRHEMGIISEATYYKKLEAIRKKYYAGKKDYLDRDRELQEEYHDWEVSKAEESYEKQAAKLQEQYVNGKITYAQLKSKLKALIKDTFKNDKDTKNKYLDELPEYLNESREEKRDKKEKEAEEKDKKNREDFDASYDKLKYQLENGFITEEKYYKDLDALYKKHYGNKTKYLDEYAQYSQEVYDGFKDMYKEGLEADKKTWEEKKEAVSEYYDELIEKIQDAHDEEDYEEEQTEKRQTLSDIERQIAELEKDGSEKAKARIAELEEDRKNAEKELEDFEKDHARQEEIERLEKEREAREKEIENEIKEIDKQLEDLNTNTATIRDLIIDYAKEKGVTLKFAHASGTRSSPGGFGRINEKGIEMISAPDGNGNYIPMLPNSYVFSAKATEFLWKLATEHSLPQAMYNSIAKSIKTQSNTPSVNIAQPITITTGDIIIKGNADKQTVADIKKQQENTVRMVLQKIKELQK